MHGENIQIANIFMLVAHIKRHRCIMWTLNSLQNRVHPEWMLSRVGHWTNTRCPFVALLIVALLIHRAIVQCRCLVSPTDKSFWMCNSRAFEAAAEVPAKFFASRAFCLKCLECIVGNGHCTYVYSRIKLRLSSMIEVLTCIRVCESAYVFICCAVECPRHVYYVQVATSNHE